MDSWNYLGTYIGLKQSKARWNRYVEKLHIKYGNIDGKKAIKLEKFCKYGLGILYILLGLSVRKASIAIMAIFVISIVFLILYYPIRKKYIIINDNEKNKESQ